VKCRLYRPEKVSDVPKVIKECHAGVIAHGGGMSYGDASLNKAGVLLTERLERFLAFDLKKGHITVEAGVTLAEILGVIVPQGWFLPVIPGTKFATAGGCFAANVHGKNAYKRGEFAKWVSSIVLRTVEGKQLTCSPGSHSDIFWATAGGMGMTGVIEELTLRLVPISAAELQVERCRTKNLEDMVQQFRQGLKRNADYMVGWIDHFGKGAQLGRGVFESAWHTKEKHPESLKAYKAGKPEFDVPFYLPPFILNKYVMAYYNQTRFAGLTHTPKQSKTKLDGFFHPLDTIGKWNRLYGRRGFLQYQCLVPESGRISAQLKQILEMIQKSGEFSFLAVLKYHGRKEGIMSFSEPGFSLALDFPNTPKVLKLLAQVDEYLCSIGGRVYLAKDARLEAKRFEKMYRHALPKWRRILKRVDPKGKLRSEMAARLGFRKDV
jgi:FAD/FMN-containing dehydrogenase